MLYPYLSSGQRIARFSMDGMSWLMPQGFYTTETLEGQTEASRWTSGSMRVSLPSPGDTVGVQIVMRGRPNGTPGTTITAGGMRLALDVGPAMRRYTLLLPPTDGERIDLQLESPTAVIADRPLGVLIRTITVIGGGSPPRAVLPLSALVLVVSYMLALRIRRTPWMIAGALLAALLLLLRWHSVYGWSYAVMGGALLTAVITGVAALVYEQIGAAQLRRGHVLGVGAGALVAVAIPWMLGQPPAQSATLVSGALLAVAAYTWQRSLGLHALVAYGVAIMLGAIALIAQIIAAPPALSITLPLAGFSLSWLVLNIVPRRHQPARTRVAADGAWIMLAATIAVTLGVHTHLWQTPVSHSTDIYTLWGDSVRVAGGQNPYERVLAGNMRQNDKYATYFPLFYLLGALVHMGGLQSFNAWVGLWKIVFLACDIGVALIIFLMLQRDRPLLAGVAAASWSMSRWTLLSAISVNIDFLAIFFLILALAFLHHYQRAAAPAARLPWAALLSLSVSLAVKQISIFIVPLFVIWVWNAAAASTEPGAGLPWRSALRAAVALLAIISLPLLFAIPFLAWNVRGFVLSIMFSVTRNANDVSLGSILGELFPSLSGASARLPMLLMLLGIYAVFWRRQIPLFMAALLTMTVFVNFNMVLFHQYLTWLVPLMPLLACDMPPRVVAAQPDASSGTRNG